ncbi:hypothetical protein Dtox_2230 [Desulfofarcimen acetoxidans DSM 771]|uniref:Uncharacterized protein n=1 Tax=Desulfofarcimen acetoxidans (strain ATCC 49208 / DSM 771 / KCTC 5769 / VKM B-1644 / 5575) TaxID=485916 RepID=C8VZR9_DESAS|nr:hypothetical protein [Desulfofarcimen acetoxidans]ACV63047.1 hypothetical protein Dtox_2230 [Desulfofarcimen acetoxidans DSM 771]
MTKAENTKNWIETKFNEWIQSHSNYIITNATIDGDLLKINFQDDTFDFEMNLSPEEIEEIALIDDELKNNGFQIALTNQKIIDNIFNLEENKIISPLLSNNRIINLEKKKSRLKLLCNPEGDKVITSQLCMEVSLRLIYLLVEMNFRTKFSPEISRFASYKSDLTDCFDEFSYILIDFQNYNEEMPDEEKVCKLINVIFYYNTIIDILIIPEGLSNSTKLLKFKLNETGDDDCTNLPYRQYDLESLIYYLSSSTHDDFRFEYLDLYHVLEYYFDRSALHNINNLIKKNLGNPTLYFKEDEIYKLSKEIKDIIVVDKKIYKEEQSLLLVLKLISLETIVRKAGEETAESIDVKLPEIKENNIQRLYKIEIKYNKTSHKSHIPYP